MAKTILVPTDLQVGSLNALKAALYGNDKDGVKVILMHAVHPPDGITDLLFYSPRKAVREQTGPAFKEALAVLRNHFEHRIASMEIVPFHGITQTAFDQFLSANGVEEIHLSGAYEMRLHERAMDPMPFIRKSKVELREHGQAMASQTAQSHPNLDHLQLLFER